MTVAFPAGIILDSGVGSDLNPIGSPWVTDPLGQGWTALKRLTNQIAGSGTGANNSYYNSPATGPDCDAWATIATLDLTSGNGVGISCRTTPGLAAASSHYQSVTVRGSSTNVQRLFKYVSSTFTKLGADETTVLAAGNSLGVRALGTTITLYYNTGSWTASTLATATDSTVAGVAGTFSDLEIDGTTYRVTNFGAGRIGSFPIKPRRMQTQHLAGIR